jgi:hypothetical protein
MSTVAFTLLTDANWFEITLCSLSDKSVIRAVTVLRAGGTYLLSITDRKCRKCLFSTKDRGRLQLTIKSCIREAVIAFC